MKSLPKFRFALIILLIVFAIFTIWANHSISSVSQSFVTDNLNELKPIKVGLLLGTSKSTRNGSKNDFFYNRIQATVELFKNNKIKYVIVSGDNGTSFYNEPQDM